MRSVNNDSPKDAGEIADALGELLGGVWFGYEAGQALPDRQVFAQFGEGPSGRKVLTGIVLAGEPLRSDDLRRIPMAALENTASLSNKAGRAARKEIEKLPPLKRHESASPDEFSQLVASHYNAWSALVAHPAPAIAEEQHVNVRTVHTWIREARLRGYITTGTRRKASRVDPT